jgi:Protein of unknown function (DUF3987)
MSTEPHGNEVIVPDYLRELINVPETPSSEKEANAVSQDPVIVLVSNEPTPAVSQSDGATERSSSSATIGGVMESRPASSWDDPDTYFVQAQRLVGPEVPLQVIGAGSRNLLQNIVRALGAPMVYALLALLVSTATVFGCARRIRVTSGWVEPGLLGGILVGPPGALKSPTCDAFVRALFMIEAHEGQMYHAHCQRLAEARLVAAVRDRVYSQEVQRAVLAGAPPPPRLHVTAADLRDPPAPALVSTSGSPEGLRQRAAQSPTGLLLWRDELARLDQEMRRSGVLRALLLSALDGRAESVDLVSRDRLEASHLSWTLLSTVQPEILSKLTGALDDGLWSRLLWAVADRPDMTTPDGSALPAGQIDRLFRKMRESLGAITWGRNLAPVEIACTPQAAMALVDARRRWEKRSATETGALASAYAKAGGLATRIAHALAQIEWASSAESDPLREISHEPVTGAIALVDEVFLAGARGVLSIATPPAEEAAARDLVNVIVSRGLDHFSPRDDIQRRVGGPLSQSKNLADAVQRLEAAGLVRRETVSSGPAGGAPRNYVVVNPRLHQAATIRR